MRKYLIILFIFFFTLNSNSFSNQKIIDQLKSINSLEFKFIQKIDNNNIETGECIILYPKKILCKYNDLYNKVLVSNGKSLIINSDKIKNHYRYPLDKTPLNIILDKEFLISKMDDLIEDETYPFYHVYNFDYDNILIKVFFDKKSFELIGWETKDIYQNTAFTLLNSVKKNQNINQELFKLPSQN